MEPFYDYSSEGDDLEKKKLCGNSIIKKDRWEKKSRGEQRESRSKGTESRSKQDDYDNEGFLNFQRYVIGLLIKNDIVSIQRLINRQFYCTPISLPLLSPLFILRSGAVGLQGKGGSYSTSAASSR